MGKTLEMKNEPVLRSEEVEAGREARRRRERREIGCLRGRICSMTGRLVVPGWGCQILSSLKVNKGQAATSAKACEMLELTI